MISHLIFWINVLMIWLRLKLNCNLFWQHFLGYCLWDWNLVIGLLISFKITKLVVLFLWPIVLIGLISFNLISLLMRVIWKIILFIYLLVNEDFVVLDKLLFKIWRVKMGLLLLWWRAIIGLSKLMSWLLIRINWLGLSYIMKRF